MAVVPVAGETEQIRWECTHCNHDWQGKPKAARTNSGNPTCSSCGRRSGSRPKPESVDNGGSAADHGENRSNDQAAGAFLGLVLGTAIDRLTEENREVM